MEWISFTWSSCCPVFWNTSLYLTLMYKFSKIIAYFVFRILRILNWFDFFLIFFLKIEFFLIPWYVVFLQFFFLKKELIWINMNSFYFCRSYCSWEEKNFLLFIRWTHLAVVIFSPFLPRMYAVLCAAITRKRIEKLEDINTRWRAKKVLKIIILPELENYSKVSR